MLKWTIVALVLVAEAKIRPGIFYFPTEEDVGDNPSGTSRPRTFFSSSSLDGFFTCKEPATEAKSNYTISVWTFKTKCYRIYNDEVNRQTVSGIVNYLLAPTEDNTRFVEGWAANWDTAWIRCYEMDVTCDTPYPAIPDKVTAGWRLCKGYEQYRRLSNKGGETDKTETETETKTEDDEVNDENGRNKRDTESSLREGIKEITKGNDPLSTKKTYNIINITKTGSFYIGWQVTGSQNSPVNRKYVELTIKARDNNLHSYLEAKDYPLLIFFGILSGVYALLALIWLIVCGCHYRDILQIQIWIGGMLALNMVEMSVFCNKYQTVNNGQEVSDSLVVFAELLSTFKHGLSRILVLIICMGYGIVKPRLGTTKHLVLALGLAYCLFVAIDSIYVKLVAPTKPMTQRQRLYAYIPRAVVNAVLIWWIIASLVSTIRTLRMRRNVIKLTLYRHFSNALAFGILSCVAFEIWWIHLTKEGCIQNWKEYWLSDDIFWNVLFTMILMVIMFLWRPTVNNSRYAFSPLLDTDEEESEETINEAFEGMKMRNIKKNGSAKKEDRDIDEDLKWVEENIPSTLGDTVFEKLMDSDEEVEHRKYEMSKMQ
ncbi:hypothetical protein ACHWQZ_G001003 [Mnemiopsis leidyi]